MDKTKKHNTVQQKKKSRTQSFALLISALVVIGIAFAAVLIIKRINTVARKNRSRFVRKPNMHTQATVLFILKERR